MPATTRVQSPLQFKRTVTRSMARRQHLQDYNFLELTFSRGKVVAKCRGRPNTSSVLHGSTAKPTLITHQEPVDYDDAPNPPSDNDDEGSCYSTDASVTSQVNGVWKRKLDEFDQFPDQPERKQARVDNQQPQIKQEAQAQQQVQPEQQVQPQIKQEAQTEQQVQPQIKQEAQAEQQVQQQVQAEQQVQQEAQPEQRVKPQTQKDPLKILKNAFNMHRVAAREALRRDAALHAEVRNEERPTAHLDQHNMTASKLFKNFKPLENMEEVEKSLARELINYVNSNSIRQYEYRELLHKFYNPNCAYSVYLMLHRLSGEVSAGSSVKQALIKVLLEKAGCSPETMKNVTVDTFDALCRKYEQFNLFYLYAKSSCDFSGSYSLELNDSSSRDLAFFYEEAVGVMGNSYKRAYYKLYALYEPIY